MRENIRSRLIFIPLRSLCTAGELKSGGIPMSHNIIISLNATESVRTQRPDTTVAK